MKYFSLKIILIIILILPLSIISCSKEYKSGIIGRGAIETRTLVMDDFTGFKNTISADIYISQGDEQKVIIEAQENIIDILSLDRVESGFWTIKYDDLDFVGRIKPVKIYITVPSLDKLETSGSGDVRGETSFTDLDKLELVVSGSGNIFLDLESEALELTISGSGNINLSGEAKTIGAKISGSGNIKAFDLLSNRVICRIAGGGDGRLSVEDHLIALISGGGDIIYKGTPEMHVRVSGSGKVIAHK